MIIEAMRYINHLMVWLVGEKGLRLDCEDDWLGITSLQLLLYRFFFFFPSPFLLETYDVDVAGAPILYLEVCLAPLGVVLLCTGPGEKEIEYGYKVEQESVWLVELPSNLNSYSSSESLESPSNPFNFGFNLN